MKGFKTLFRLKTQNKAKQHNLVWRVYTRSSIGQSLKLNNATHRDIRIYFQKIHTLNILLGNN